MTAMGFILLEGGAEFGGRMADPDSQAMTLAGGPDVPIRIIPAAAAPDNNHQRAGQNGLDWLAGDVNRLSVGGGDCRQQCRCDGAL